MEIFMLNPGLIHIGQKILKNLDLRSQLTCRLVCKSWKVLLEDCKLNKNELKYLFKARFEGGFLWRCLCYNCCNIKEEERHTFLTTVGGPMDCLNKLSKKKYERKQSESREKWERLISLCCKKGIRSSLIFYLKDLQLLKKVNATTPLKLFVSVGDLEMVKVYIDHCEIVDYLGKRIIPRK